MAVNRTEAAKPSANGAEAAAAAPTAAPAAGGGMKAWLPLVANLVLMPVLAYGITTFLLIPKLRATSGAAAEAPAGEHGEAAPASGHGEKEGKESAKEGAKPKESGGKGKEGAKGKITAPLPGKVLVNLAGTLGTRYLLANITLVSGNPDLKNLVEKNDAQLKDVAASTLGTKTIPDLEKPGARNLIRTELISAFNGVLGNNVVSDIYLTEFAIQ